MLSGGVTEHITKTNKKTNNNLTHISVTGIHRVSAVQTYVLKTSSKMALCLKSSLLSSGSIYPAYHAHVLNIQWYT